MQQIELGDLSEQLTGLVAQVEAGDEVVLTRKGKAVARIVPGSEAVHKSSELSREQQASALQSMATIRKLRDELKLGPFHFEDFKRDRDEGRA